MYLFAFGAASRYLSKDFGKQCLKAAFFR